MPQPAKRRRFPEVIMAAILMLGHRLTARAFRAGPLLLAVLIIVSCGMATDMEASMEAGPVLSMRWWLAMRALPTDPARRSSAVFA